MSNRRHREIEPTMAIQTTIRRSLPERGNDTLKTIIHKSNTRTNINVS